MYAPTYKIPTIQYNLISINICLKLPLTKNK